MDPSEGADDSVWGRFLSLLSRWFDFPPKVVILDTGMIAELTRADQQSVIDFFKVRPTDAADRRDTCCAAFRIAIVFPSASDYSCCDACSIPTTP